MSEWKKRAKISGDVVFFKYDSSPLNNLREVFIWDLDKTYLDTKFETISGLLNTIFEQGNQKRNIPGTDILVKNIYKNYKEKFQDEKMPFFFITGSPPQLEKKIMDKLKIDGVTPLGVFFKDNIQNLKPGRLWRLNKQVGYKLHALLQLRKYLGEGCKQTLWGDDSENDSVIYSLYSDICANRLTGTELGTVLKFFHVTGEQLDCILKLQKEIPVGDPVEKIYINLEDDTDYEYYLKFGRRVLPTYNSFQTALDLFQDSRVKEEDIVHLGHYLNEKYDYTCDEFEKNIDDLVRRGVLGESTMNKILPHLISSGLINKNFEFSIDPKKIINKVNGRVFELEGAMDPWVPEKIDYLHDYR